VFLTLTTPRRGRRPRRPVKPKEYCSGTELVDGACKKCYRDELRVKADGQTYKHYAKAPVHKSDPKHSVYIEKTYGITGAQYEQLLAFQEGKCFICEKRPAAKRLAVDHDHASGNVRGLLCRRCNHRLLGSAHDETRILERAIQYLNNPPASICFDTVIRKEP
jgi:hypothetical protein